MEDVKIRNGDFSPEIEYMIDALPGAGLVGKIAGEFLIERLGMEYYASVESEDLPPIMIYEDEYDLKALVQIYADPESGVGVVTSDIPIFPDSREFFRTLVEWLNDKQIMPICLVGQPIEESENEVYGVSTGGARKILDRKGFKPPPGVGAVTGYTGVLLHEADNANLSSLGFVVDVDSFFPDPGAAGILIDEAIEPVTGIEIDTDQLLETEDQIKKQKEKLAKELKQIEKHEAGHAYPTEMYK
ncbi:MAG: proteasome assembly chaperone family protein [Candidatus Nanohaloarchaea archaeon]